MNARAKGTRSPASNDRSRARRRVSARRIGSIGIDSELIVEDAVGTDGNIKGLGGGRGEDANRAEARGELQRLFCV